MDSELSSISSQVDDELITKFRGAASGLPLESLGVANKRFLQFIQVYSRLFQVKALKSHHDNMLKSLCSSFMMSIREHFHSFQRLFKQI